MRSFHIGTNQHVHSQDLQHRQIQLHLERQTTTTHKDKSQGTVQAGLNSRSSCLCLPGTKISDMHYQASTWLSVHWSVSLTPPFYSGHEGTLATSYIFHT